MARHVLVLATLLPAACTSIDLDIPEPTSPRSRYLQLGRQAQSCEVIARLPTASKIPAILSDGSGPRYLFEVVPSDDYPVEEEILIAKVDADPALIPGLLRPLPPAINAWSLDQGKLSTLSADEAASALAGVAMVAPDKCAEAVEQACSSSFPRCLQPERVVDFVLKDGYSANLGIASAGDRVFAVAGKAAYVVDETEEIRIGFTPEIVATTSDGQRGAYLLDTEGCLWHVGSALTPQKVACAMLIYGIGVAALARAEDGSIWMLYKRGLYVYRNGTATEVRALTVPVDDLVRLTLLSDDEALLAFDGPETHVYWHRRDELIRLDTIFSVMMVKDINGGLLLLEKTSAGTATYRFDLEASRVLGEPVYELDQRIDIVHPRIMVPTDYGYFLGRDDGTMVRLPEHRDCELPAIPRMPVVADRYDRGVAVLGNDYLDFNYLAERDTRLYLFLFDSPELSCR